ncbi:galactokinase [Hymenobacter koreensis]|uniref:Galactokinase n=1 Tax=Hymenobacter koreensis TaxID=1084523 RepID=A0ABP8JMD8_9BACT
MTLAQAIAEEFRRQFGHEPLQVRAPGRINLIGEHTDYNAGFVLPAAIDREMVFAVALNNEGTYRLRSYDLKESVTATPETVQRSEKVQWANYLLGVVAQFQKRGIQVPGFDCVFGGNVPIGAGLSSSAAVECGLAFALDHLLKTGIDRMELALMAQKAEHEFALVMCGIMDQFASMFGQDGHVVRLDCRSLEYEYYPFDAEGVRVVLCNSGVKHSLASSEYNVRRQECEQGVTVLQAHYPNIQTLRDATLEQVHAHQQELGPVVYRRCVYVVEENARVEAACQALVAGNLTEVGRLMYASHTGLRDQYEVSCKELDVLVEASRGVAGVYGSRMMGGGFGGCTINLVQAEHADAFEQHMKEAYQRQLNLELECYQTRIVAGAGLINNS